MDQLDQLKAQLKQVEDQLNTENAKGAAKDAAAVSVLEQHQADLLKQIMDAKQAVIASIATTSLADLQSMADKILAEVPLDKELLLPVQAQIATLEQTQAHEERVQHSTNEFNTMIDSLDLGSGVTLRQLIGSEDYYQLAVIGIKGAFQAQADTFSKQIGDLTTTNADLTKSNDALRSKLAQIADENTTLTNQLNQEKLDHAQTQQYRDNAVSQLEEANKVIEQKNGHIADLQDQISRGVGASIKTVNSEDEKAKQAELAAKFKQEHTVYDVKADDPLNPKMYTAKLAYNDQPVTYSWIAKNSYTELKSTDEVSQFRSQYPSVAQDNSANPALDESVQAETSVTEQEKQFLQAPHLPVDTTTTGLANQEQGIPDAGTVTREEFDALAQRVTALENVHKAVA